MKNIIDRKVFQFDMKTAEKETRSGGEYGLFEGYASTFGNMDQGMDIVDKGAFKVTIKQNNGRFPILADHNWEAHIGYNESAKEDNRGLLVSGAINLQVQKGLEKYALAKQALELDTPMGLSIGYTTIQASPDQKNPNVRHLTELKLWEYSFVTFPMNVEAMVTTAKSLGDIDKARFIISQLKEQGISIADLEMALRDEAAKNDSDPTLISQSLDNLIAKFKN